jgi:superfamily I DNA/RNA helicase
MPPPAFLSLPEQNSVVTYRGRRLQLIIRAGSGKTEAISRRVSTLIEEGVEPRAELPPKRTWGLVLEE